MSLPRNSTGGVSASRSVALDLMLRTFMNSSEFHSSRPRVWENVSRLVPGTTPQQCYERWEELRRFASHSANRDCSELTAYGRPVSSKSHNNRYREQTNRSSKLFTNTPHFTSDTSSPLPHPPHPSISSLKPQSQVENTFSLSRGEELKQLIPNKTEEREEDKRVVLETGLYESIMDNHRESNKEEKDSESGVILEYEEVKRAGKRESSQSKLESDTVIHVFDDHRKSKREFRCPRTVLVKEMKYFAEYLSSDTQLWDEVDISVHCDITVFDWLMRYTKRGLLEGPRGEILDEPLEPLTLETTNVVSILISSDFLKMDPLVEECLDYCHENLSAVLSSPTNMGCISHQLRERLAAKFTPTELEAVVDKKDKIRSKLFVNHIQQLFSPSFTNPQCPANATTLFRCRHCGRLLTLEQSTLLSCSNSRLEVSVDGRLVWSHERDTSWSVTTYLSSLRWQQNLSPRDIYWRLWGIVNWLRCSSCGQIFQCRDLSSCSYHLQPALSGHASTGPPVHICCGNISTSLSPFPPIQTGCCRQDHTVKDTDSSFHLFSLLLSHRDIICSNTDPVAQEEKNSKSLSLLDTTAQLGFLRNIDTRWSERKTSLKTFELFNLRQKREEREQRPGQVRDSKIGNGGGREKGTITSKPLATVAHQSRRRRTLSEVSSEMEEDEEEEEVARGGRRHQPHNLGGGSLVKQSHRRETSKQLTNHRSSFVRRRQSSVSAQPVTVQEHVWDSTKSQRWNLDRQRENDERRLSLLFDHLTIHSSYSGATKTSHQEPLSCSSGGIFSKLEAKFRAQQLATRAQHTPSKIPGRKR